MADRITWEERWAGTNFGRVYEADNTDGDERVQRALGCPSKPEPAPLVSHRRITSAIGWLSPNGRWYPCREEEHGWRAQQILDSLEPGKWMGRDREHFGGYELELEKRCYVKLADDRVCAPDPARVTPRQKRLLVEWLLRDDNERMTWPWWLEPESS